MSDRQYESSVVRASNAKSERVTSGLGSKDRLKGSLAYVESDNAMRFAALRYALLAGSRAE